MTRKVSFGLDQLEIERSPSRRFPGNIGYLSHSAAVSLKNELGLAVMKRVFNTNLKKVFGPQHGFVTDVQDNMVETDDFHHPYFNLPIYSLYGETRVPTDQMLEGIDILFVDLQDVGTRVYTYITTLALTMERCAKLGIKVVVLDRPNPIGGEIIEGPVLKSDWASFVGHHPIPQRHALTIGEIANLQNKVFKTNCELEVIKMEGWRRSFHWVDINRPWINPSPNLPTYESSLIFPGSVLYEGTSISEGRGTTRSLEMLGSPNIEPFSFRDLLMKKLTSETDLSNFYLRPVQFYPMFQKHAGKPCGGVHLQPIDDFRQLRSWRLGAFLMREFAKLNDFSWNKDPYEYETHSLAINFINGSEELKNWIECDGSYEDLINWETYGHDEFKSLKEDVSLYL